MSGKKLFASGFATLAFVITGCTPSIPAHYIPAQISPTTPTQSMRLVGFLESSEPDAEDDQPENDPAAVSETDTLNHPGVGTDLASFEARARAGHPAIQLQRARVQAARGSWLQAGLPMNPIAQFQSNEIGNDDSSGIHQLQINQTIVTANKLGIARGVAAAEVRKVQADLARAELEVLTNVRTAFIAALIAQQRVARSQTLVSIARQSVDSVQIKLDGQEVSRIELLQSQTASDQAELALQNAVVSEQARRRALAAAVGDGMEIQQPLEGDFDDLLPETPWDSLIVELVAASPEMAKNTSEVERARRALNLACAQVTPNVTTQFGLGYDAATDDTIGLLGVSVPLPIRNRNDGNIARARADVAAAHANASRIELDLHNRLARAVGRYKVAKQRVEMLQQSIIPRAEETLVLSRQSFEAGETSFLELLTIQRTLSQTRLNVLDAIEQARNAAAEIDGMLVTVVN